MSKAFDNAFEFLNGLELDEAQIQDELRKVQEDMSEGLREAVAGGWMTQAEADEFEYEWTQTYMPGQE